MNPSDTPVERARPLLGTYVSIKIGGLAHADAHPLIDRGFTEIETIHRLMSFHEAYSDVSALNRDAFAGPVVVAPHTYQVVSRALEIAALSQGVFDITVAPKLVAWGFLPQVTGKADPNASWRDIELLSDNRIRFHRPLWIDLGGIAKGYAVDCAVTALAAPYVSVCVNAGGDLRVAGPARERVILRTDASQDTVPVVEIENGSIASSSGRAHVKRVEGEAVGPHVHGREKTAMGLDSFVSVLAENCMDADGLTKVVLAMGSDARACLQSFGALAYLNDVNGWQAIGNTNGGEL